MRHWKSSATRWCGELIGCSLLIGVLVSLGQRDNQLLLAALFTMFPAYWLGWRFGHAGVTATILGGILFSSVLSFGLHGAFRTLVNPAPWLIPYLTAMMAEYATRRIKLAEQTDSLTGLLNRKGFEEQLKFAVKAAVQGNRRLPVLIATMDCDQFKQFNDSRGHRAGDDLLVRAATTLKKNYQNAFIGRMGGDEFCIAWLRKSLDQSVTVASDLQAKLNHACSCDNFSITWSVGIVGYSPPAEIEVMLDRSDELMLLGKRSGSNALLGEVNGERLDFSGLKSHQAVSAVDASTGL